MKKKYSIFLLVLTSFLFIGCGEDKRTKAYKECLAGLKPYNQTEKSPFGQGYMGTCMQIKGFEYKMKF